MKSDLDDLMKSRGLDAIFVMGPAQHNPAMYYLTGGAHITGGDVIKKHGQDPVLFYNPMERDEAAKTGLRSRNLADYNMHELLKKTDGDHLKATILRYRQMFIDYELTRRPARRTLYFQTWTGISLT
jgi:Xaa-Pro aminopeptidase